MSRLWYLKRCSTFSRGLLRVSAKLEKPEQMEFIQKKKVFDGGKSYEDKF